MNAAPRAGSGVPVVMNEPASAGAAAPAQQQQQQQQLHHQITLSSFSALIHPLCSFLRIAPFIHEISVKT